MAQGSLLDVKAHTLFADGLQHQMDVGLRFIGMQYEGVAVLTPKFFPREVSYRSQDLVRWRSRWHREDELVNDLGRLSAFGAGEVGLSTHVIDIQIPIVRQRF